MYFKNRLPITQAIHLTVSSQHSLVCLKLVCMRLAPRSQFPVTCLVYVQAVMSQTMLRATSSSALWGWSIPPLECLLIDQIMSPY